jgi:hypothetical protein
MAHYGPSIFYPIIGDSHDQIVRFVAAAVRRPAFMVNGAMSQLPVNGLPDAGQVAVLDDREHVVTIERSSPSAQFSDGDVLIAFSWSLNGWLVVFH